MEGDGIMLIPIVSLMAIVNRLPLIKKLILNVYAIRYPKIKIKVLLIVKFQIK